MRSTYINDNCLANYPIAAGVHLPFPASCLTGFSMCIKAGNGWKGPSAVQVTSLNITSGSLYMTVGTDTYPVMGSLTAESGKSSRFRAEHSDYTASGWVTAGNLSEIPTGSYSGPFPLDASCVNFLTDATFGYSGRIFVNGRLDEAPERLRVNFNGYFTTEFTDGRVTVKGNIPDGEKLHEVTEGTLYSFVTSLNGLSTLREHDDLKPESTGMCLHIKSVGGAEGKAMLHYTVDNATRVSEYNHDRYRNDSSKPSINTTDNAPDAVILTVHGTSKFPSCYSALEDEADEE